MELEIFEANNGNCPYLDARQWYSYTFKSDRLDSTVYESLLTHGFRRSGKYFYKNNCPNCSECVAIRLLVNQFKMSRSQKRTWNRNKDLGVVWHPVKFDQESFELYRTYSLRKHGSEATEKNYRDFLVNSAVETIMMRYYLNNKLVGVGWLDMLPRSLSSVYFAYDLDYNKRRLGVFSVLKEVELASEMNKLYLHLGFWVNECKAMNYKKQFKPHQLLLDDMWVNSDQEVIDLIDPSFIKSVSNSRR